jgi:hypothetical protein
VKRIRGGSGLGDAIYLRPVVEHYIRQGHQVAVMSDYREIFDGTGAKVEPFTRQNCNVVAHYSSRKKCSETNQWQDIAINAGAQGLALSFEWEVQNRALVDDLQTRAGGRPIVVVNGGRWPMGRADGYAREMLPVPACFAAVLGALEDCFTVKVGKGSELYPLRTDHDLTDETTPADLLDMAKVATGLVGQCSFMIPLAEAFDCPLLVVWAAAGLTSGTEFIRQCTPQKILSKPSSRWVMDDWAPERVDGAVRSWLADATQKAPELQAA